MEYTFMTSTMIIQTEIKHFCWMEGKEREYHYSIIGKLFIFLFIKNICYGVCMFLTLKNRSYECQHELSVQFLKR